MAKEVLLFAQSTTLSPALYLRVLMTPLTSKTECQKKIMVPEGITSGISKRNRKTSLPRFARFRADVIKKARIIPVGTVTRINIMEFLEAIPKSSFEKRFA